MVWDPILLIIKNTFHTFLLLAASSHPMLYRVITTHIISHCAETTVACIYENDQKRKIAYYYKSTSLRYVKIPVRSLTKTIDTP